MGDRNVNILCYADDAVLLAESRFAATTTYIDSTAQQRIQYDHISLKYLEISISGFGDVEAEVREQTQKATRIAGA